MTPQSVGILNRFAKNDLGGVGTPGGALGGVFGAGLRLSSWYREDRVKLPFYDNDPVSQLVSAAGFLALCGYLWFGALKKTKEA